MKEEKDKWVNDVLNSMKGSAPAKPGADLFDQIQGRIDQPKAPIFSLSQQGLSIAAAVLLLLLNIFVINQYQTNQIVNSNEIGMEGSSSSELISDYKIYE